MYFFLGMKTLRTSSTSIMDQKRSTNEHRSKFTNWSRTLMREIKTECFGQSWKLFIKTLYL